MICSLSRVFALCFILVATGLGQGTLADYQRAQGLRTTYRQGVVKMPVGGGAWIQGTNSYWYRRVTGEGQEILRVDASAAKREPAFDHERLAGAFNTAAEATYSAMSLPPDMANLVFLEREKAIQFNLRGGRWRCSTSEYKCERTGSAPAFDLYSNFSESRPSPAPVPPRVSPDGKWEAFVRNYNLYVRSKDKKQELTLSTDGSEGNYYDRNQIWWSPDSKMIAVYRVRPGYSRTVHFVESSPIDQIQPKKWSLDYAKPGDTVDIESPVLFHLESKRQINVSNALFPNPYNMTAIAWRKDNRAVTFEYNQRGHQLYRVIEVDATTGSARATVEEAPKTFFTYSSKRFRHDVGDGKEMIWMSERDGWNHLYLMDENGRVKNQITKGEWVVRSVERVDEEKRMIYFRASGMYPGKDPYFSHYYRVNFDGSGLEAFTESDASHTVQFSEDLKYYADVYSRVDMPTTIELRTVADRKLVLETEKGDISAAEKTGFRPPESFVAKGRDGKTDIWGVIYRPSNFDPNKKYPVVENIYAGPHDSFVPKTFAIANPMQVLAEIGFIVVQIDGMGTSNRSKAFHDVAWQNLGDAGFPDRILWHKAVAAKYQYYDISRVGIYGTSAGGQSSTGALLFHPEFYKVAVSHVGCHDNRMDKIWWNEQWMGWPIGPHYAAASNVDNAHRLKGKLLLTVGEIDTNVDPASTMQVANALIKANKTFDLIVFPGQGHGAGGEYGERRRIDFFVRHLIGVEPPDWNRSEIQTAAAN